MGGSPPQNRNFETFPAHTHYLVVVEEKRSFKVSVSGGDPLCETSTGATTQGELR